MTTAPVFLAPRAALLGERVLLDGPEGRHAAAVRRLEVGERVDLVDGTGLRVRGVISLVHSRDAVTVDVLERIDEPVRAPRYVVVQALPKGDRGELACELLTEAGVDEVVPWQASRCVTKWSAERGAKSLARWRSSVAEAAKQSRRAAWPVVAGAATTRAVAERVGAAVAAYVLHEDATETLASVPLPAGGEVVLVVGPEGGVDPAELETLTTAGAVAVRLGPEVVRTSTAGALALAALSVRERWL